MFVYPSLRQLLLMCLVAVPVGQHVLLWLAGDRSHWFTLLLTELYLVWLALLATQRRRWPPEDLFLLNAAPATALWAAPLAAGGAALWVSGFDALCARALDLLAWAPPVVVRRTLIELQLIDGPATALLVLATVVVLPAVCEELFFRGFVLTGLRYHHGPTVAVIGSALLFAVAHLNPWQLPALLLLGLVFGLLTHWTHSIYPAMLGHAVNNLLSVIAVNLRVETGSDLLGALQAPHPGALAVAAAALAAGVVHLRRCRPLMPILSPYASPRAAAGLLPVREPGHPGGGPGAKGNAPTG